LASGSGAVSPNTIGSFREAILVARGRLVRIEGDSFFAVFPDATDAVMAAVGAQRGLGAHAWEEEVPIRVRMGLHTDRSGMGDDYTAIARASRIMSAAHGARFSFRMQRMVSRRGPRRTSAAECRPGWAGRWNHWSLAEANSVPTSSSVTVGRAMDLDAAIAEAVAIEPPTSLPASVRSDTRARLPRE
jgi:hypothetical protein